MHNLAKKDPIPEIKYTNTVQILQHLVLPTAIIIIFFCIDLFQGRPPSIFGYQDFRFPRSFGFRDGISGMRQTSLLPRRFQRLDRFGGPSSPFRMSPFGPRFGSSRFPSLSGRGTNDLSLSRRQVGGLSRFPSRPLRLNPTLSSARRRIPPQFAGARSRLPFLYYGQDRVSPIGGPRPRIIPNDAIRQLRQRFRTTGSGTRADPIRIISPLSGSSGALQRSSRPQRRPVQLSRARQQLQPRQPEEVLALFGFDQPAGGSIGAPILSETIDKQTKVKRTPIKKSPSVDSKIIKPAADLKGTKELQSVNISKPITDEFLQKLDVHQLERLAKGVAQATKTQIQHEVKHVAKVTEGHSLSQSETLSKDPAGISVIADPAIETHSFVDTEKIGSVSTSTSISSGMTKSVESIGTTEELLPVENLQVSDIVVPVEEGVVSEIVTPVESVSVSDAVVPVEATSSAEVVASVEGMSVTDVVFPVETDVKAEVVATAEGVPVTDVIVPVEATATAEVVATAEGLPVTDVVVPVEASATVEVLATVEGVPVNDVVPIEATATAEMVPTAEGLPINDVVPIEATAEVVASVEGVPVTEAVVPIEAAEVIITAEAVTDVVPVEAIAAEMVATVEGVSISDVVVPVETAASAEVIATAEDVPVTDVVVPVEASVKAEGIISVEGVPVSDVVVPIEASAIKEAMAPTESITLSDTVIPAKLSIASDSTVTSESVVSKGSPVLHVSETKEHIKTAPIKEVSNSVVETAAEITAPAKSDPSVSLEGKLSAEISVPIKSETAAAVETIAPKIHLPNVGHDVHTGIPEHHVSVGKSVHQVETSPIVTEGKLLR